MPESSQQYVYNVIGTELVKWRVLPESPTQSTITGREDAYIEDVRNGRRYAVRLDRFADTPREAIIRGKAVYERAARYHREHYEGAISKANELEKLFETVGDKAEKKAKPKSLRDSLRNLKKQKHRLPN